MTQFAIIATSGRNEHLTSIEKDENVDFLMSCAEVIFPQKDPRHFYTVNWRGKEIDELCNDAQSQILEGIEFNDTELSKSVDQLFPAASLLAF